MGDGSRVRNTNKATIVYWTVYSCRDLNLARSDCLSPLLSKAIYCVKAASASDLNLNIRRRRVNFINVHLGKDGCYS